MSYRLVLADDHKIIRDGLRSLIETISGLEVVGEAEDGRRAVALAAELAPDLIIMDIGMPDLNGIEATRQILADHPRVHVIALSMHSEAKFVSRMLEAGASGYLLKDCAFDELHKAIKTVRRGGIYLSEGITGVVVEDYVRHMSATEAVATPVLTPKEREVLQLIAEGAATKEIARHLHVSVKTIETHRKHIMDKLGLDSIAALTKHAIREGMTEL